MNEFYEQIDYILKSDCLYSIGWRTHLWKCLRLNSFDQFDERDDDTQLPLCPRSGRRISYLNQKDWSNYRIKQFIINYFIYFLLEIFTPRRVWFRPSTDWISGNFCFVFLIDLFANCKLISLLFNET